MGINFADLVSGGVFSFAGKIIDKIFPDPEAKAKAQVALMEAAQRGDLETLHEEMSVMLAEAQSPDKWTSRARPSFLYVVYVILLFSIPMGFVYAVSPSTAGNITLGFKAWLASIPDSFIQLFGVVMLGYIGGRSWEKVKGAAT
jgi:hypothetical protein